MHEFDGKYVKWYTFQMKFFINYYTFCLKIYIYKDIYKDIQAKISYI